MKPPKAGDRVAYWTREGKHESRVLHITKGGLIAVQRGDEILYRKPKNVKLIDPNGRYIT